MQGAFPQSEAMQKAKYPCGPCDYAVKSTGIQCTNCTAWFHINCSNTSNEEMSFHNKHPNAVWLCPACDINFFTSAFFDSASDLANSIDVSNPLESLSSSDEGVSDPVETPRV